MKRGQQQLGMPIFPQEIVENILSRLPVNCLLRFRCVCKPWNSLITSTHFINMHLSRRTSDPINQNNQSLFVLSKDRLYCIDLHKTPNSHLSVPVELGILSVVDLVMCSCNGLILVVGEEETLFLLNPSTRESKRLPDWPYIAQAHLGFYDSFSKYGFGYDSSLDDYKVVRICCIQKDTYEDAFVPVVGVYTLKTNSWRVIEESRPYNHYWCDQLEGTLLNGAIHWLIPGGKGSDNSPVIVCFNITNDTFCDLLVPPPASTDYQGSLGVLGGCLCVIWYDCCLCHDVWVMRESWTKFRINPPSCSHPLIFLRDFIVYNNGEKLLGCDPREESFMDLVVNGDLVVSKATAYVESLVSPNYNDATEGQI